MDRFEDNENTSSKNMRIYSLSDNTPDTFDSYFGTVIRKNNALVIPYINFGIAEHPLNPASHLIFIDRVYVVLNHATYFKKNNAEVVIDLERSLPSFYFGGHNLDPSNGFIEIEAKAKEAFLYLFEDSKISEKMWIPIKTPRADANMELSEALQFLKGENLPGEIRAVLNQQ